MLKEFSKKVLTKSKHVLSRIWKSKSQDEEEKTDTDWRSIYIASFVALIASIQGYSIVPTMWPYIKFLNPNVSEIANGVFQGTSALGNAIASIFAGYLVNRISNTKPPLIIAKVLMIIGTFVYLAVEVDKKAALYLLIAYQLIMGTASGFGNVYRTHIAMATQESERSRGYGLGMLSNSLGTILGPLVQMLFALIPYPGIKLLFGMHFNLFTAAVYLALITSIIGILALIFFFNGKLNVLSKEERVKQQLEIATILPAVPIDEAVIDEKIKVDEVEEIKYDRVAVCILIFTKITQEINILILMSIAMPYAMTVFEWDSHQLILYQSLFMAPMGFCSLVFSFCYIRFKFDKKIPVRIALLIGLGLFMFFFIATFPWPFISQTIPYAHEKNVTAFFKQSEAAAALAMYNETGELVGCNIAYKWCETTPRIHIAVFSTSNCIYNIRTSMDLVVYN
uniref:Major facilitator superfamily (MFS) profile domain-containing protein n=1 Tax=Panagrolaimus sp. ES5 TaxID=591445 RepID=A0AC34GSP6_9BILA